MKIVVNVPVVPTKEELKNTLISIIETQLPAESVMFIQRIIVQAMRLDVDETPNCALEQAMKTEKRKRSEADSSAEDKN